MGGGAPASRGSIPTIFAHLGNHVLGGGGFISRLYKGGTGEKGGLSTAPRSDFQPMRVSLPAFIAGLQQTSFAQKAVDQCSLGHGGRGSHEVSVAEGPSVTEREASISRSISGGFCA